MVRLQEVAGTDKNYKIALDLNIGPSAVTNWVKRGVSKEGALAAAEKYNANANYILNGTPSPDLINTPNLNDFYVPIISWVAAVSYLDVTPATFDDAVDWITRPRHLSKRAFGLIIQGRKMWPEFKPNDIIYVEPDISQEDLIDGDLVVTHFNGDKQVTFNQVIMGDGLGEMYLKPLNPDWPNQEIVAMSGGILIGVVDSKVTRYRQIVTS